MGATVFCYGEGQRFPVSEFRMKDGRLVVPEIHETDIPHYASDGEPVMGDQVEPTFEIDQHRAGE